MTLIATAADPSLSPFMRELVSESPAVVALLVIVYAFLKHMRADTQLHIDARRNADELFVSALHEIRKDVRSQASAARESDLAVANAVGELTARMADLSRLESQLHRVAREVDDASDRLQERTS